MGKKTKKYIKRSRLHHVTGVVPSVVLVVVRSSDGDNLGA